MSDIKPIETRYKGYRFRSLSRPMDPIKRMSARADRAGLRFGRLLVIECLGVAPAGYRWWGCVCDCGNKVAVRSRELDKGHTRSCGCLQAETRARYPGANRLPYGHASRNELLASYKKSARQRDIAWELSSKDFFELTSSPCAYCGSDPNLVRKPNKGVNGEYVYSGVDRIDNTIGYVPGNVVSCCWVCNRAKGELGLQEFLQWCETVARHQAARSARFEHGECG
jgi:hypothetical protein